MNKSVLDTYSFLLQLRNLLFIPVSEYHYTIACPQTGLTSHPKGKWTITGAKGWHDLWVPVLMWKNHVSLQHPAPLFTHFKVPINVLFTQVPLSIPHQFCWWEVCCMRESCMFSFFICDMGELTVQLMFFLIHVTEGPLFITSFLLLKRKYVHTGSKLLRILY